MYSVFFFTDKSRLGNETCVLKENNKKKEGDSMTKKYLFCFN